MLHGIPDVILYFDDICIASETPGEHYSTLKAVFERLQEYNFRVKLEKYKDGLRPDPAKTDAIRRMPASRNVQELRSYLGALQFWGKFVPSMSDLRTPLDNPLKKNARSFQKFKKILGSELLLMHFTPKYPIHVASDASSYAIGYVLSRLISNQPPQDDEIIIAQISMEEQEDDLVIQDALQHLPVDLKMVKKAMELFTTLQDVSKFITGAKSPVKTHLASWPLSTRPWQRVHIDYAKYKNAHYLLVIDAFSKWPEIFKVTTTTTSQTISKLTEIFARHGLAETLVSDNGTQFVNEEFAKFCKRHGIQHLRTAPYSPASNGQCERLVDTLKRSLEKQKSAPVDEALQRFLASYRFTTNENCTDSKSPAEIIYSRRARAIVDLLKDQPEEPMGRNESMATAYNRRHGTTI
ncbi:uncharacterized protein K02A2.6-like [Phlebotomus papatasi]|uniref:uncharacterized protein K02A2.6-like n=1 Tax=Phlebotomus papatasi TaxID=29031 RepID=UPI002483C365|nr:uncharacterized protein K02A2.6-like [Phlebotomus papatasi]